MLNLDDDFRGRLANSMSHWSKEHDIFRMARKELIMHHAGSVDFAKLLGIDLQSKEMIGNLIQLGAQSHSLQLAYGMPQFKFVAMAPELDEVAGRLQASINRYMHLLDAIHLTRALALDCYFGWSIATVDVGLLPPAVQAATGMTIGPVVRRVSQDDFFFDGHSTELTDMGWMAHTYLVPLAMAQTYPKFNPAVAADLTEWSYSNQDSRTRSQVGVNSSQSAEAMTRLVSVYFPRHNCRAIWPASDTQFNGVRGEPLMVESWEGHYSGPYEVLSMLDIPDNLLPIPISASVKRLHIIFNNLADITSSQAESAKFNPIFEVGSERDAKRLQNAKDREMVPVSRIDKIGQWQLPGPDASQTQYMGAALQLFNQFSGNINDVLGTDATAPTATQSQLIRQATSVRAADRRQRFQRMLANIATKLGHFFLNSPDLFIPARELMPNTRFTVDMSWLPESHLARPKNIDEFQISVVPYSSEYRDPAVRLAQLNEATQQIFQAMQLATQGVPLDLEAFIELQADYRDLPEVRKIYSGLLPEYVERRGNAQLMSQQRADVGQYQRTNVSAQTNGGALMQNLFQSGGENGQGGPGGMRLL